MKNDTETAENHDAKALARRGIIYERAGFYAVKTPKGFEVYAPSASGTHAQRCAVIGWKGDEGLTRARAEVDKRAARR